ncbi:hypothetical protein BB558_003315 [Smittium angustum]|uniref:Dynein heavy chain, cytoplasmic n=1 Tax=Smittium angustum TaxID=133377 RepID=A0A2U1J6C0_SMIAN|nr:hypothetical protein BB558_003315 [Smittium angustum]
MNKNYPTLLENPLGKRNGIEEIHPSSSSTVSLVDPNIIKKFILNLTPALLGGDGSEENIPSMFAFPESIDRCKQFANDPQFSVLYIVKEMDEPPRNEDGSLITDSFLAISYSIELNLIWRKNLMGAIALIKRSPMLDDIYPISQQVQVINLPGPSLNRGLDEDLSEKDAIDEIDIMDSKKDEKDQKSDLSNQTPYEALHSLIHFGVAPYLNSFIEAKQKSTDTSAVSESMSNKRELKESDSGLPMAKKRMAELELALLQLQHNTEIPEPNLTISRIVKKEVEASRIENRRATVNSIDPATLSDSSFLNRLTADVNGWIKEIQKVTNLVRDPVTMTASQEINFWLNMERGLERIEEQLASDEVTLTLDILRAAKRFHVTVSFMADTGLKEATELVLKYNVLMKDFPLNDLLAATDMNKICEGVEAIFVHINKKLRLTPYPVKRALSLVETISVDFNNQLLKVLGGRRLLYMEIDAFDQLLSGAETAFSIWDENFKDFVNVARDVTRKRSERFIPIKITPSHNALQERLKFVSGFRKQHEQLQRTISQVMELDSRDAMQVYSSDNGIGSISSSLSSVDCTEEIKLAYDAVKHVNVLDVSKEGVIEWEQAEAIYDERVSRVENQTISRLRDRLATCKNASEMFRVFSKFNALFVRPKIRGAIQEYQTQLISSVKEDISKLHEKFKKHFHRSSAFKMTQLRDVPPVSGAIIWTKEIERQLNYYMKRVEAVFGNDWELYVEGQRLKGDSDSFRQKLDTRPLYDTWYYEISRRDLSVTGRVFVISKQRATNQLLQINIQFDAQLVSLFKEVREMLSMGFPVPHTLVNVARDGKRVYPYAVSLGESIRLYKQTINNIHQNPGIANISAGYRNEVQSLIERGFHMRWDLFVNTLDLSSAGGREQRHITFVRELALVTSKFQEKTEALVQINNTINNSVKELADCKYNEQDFKRILDEIQQQIDKLSLANVTNLEQWVQDLDERIEAVFSVRVEHALRVWVAEFMKDPENETDDSDSDTKNSNRRLLQGLDDKDLYQVILLKEQVHEIRIKNQAMFIDPPLESARAAWIRQLHEYLSIVCLLLRPQASRYNSSASGNKLIGFTSSDSDVVGGLGAFFDTDHLSESNSVRLRAPRPTTYKDILSRLPHRILSETYKAIELRVSQASQYVSMWLQYQSLWDLNIDHVSSFLGDDLERWQTIIGEIRKARSTFDNEHTYKYIGGHMKINYGQVQSKVNSKYDSWQKDILSKFCIKLGDVTRVNYKTISETRRSLEKYSSDTASTTEAVAFITFMEDIKRQIPEWKVFIESQSQRGQRLLEKHRFQLPQDWIYHDRIEGEWSAFNEIMESKTRIIEEQVSGLQMQISAEATSVSSKVNDLCEKWEKQKPTEGSIPHSQALEVLGIFETKMNKLKEEVEQVNKAKLALGLQSGDTKVLEPVIDELRDLKSVWSALSVVWAEINELKEMPWASVVPRKLRMRLDALKEQGKNMTDKVRQYSAFKFMYNYILTLSKHVSIVSDLKSDALKDRHWRQLFKNLGISARSLTEITLGFVWSFDISKNESVIRDVVTIAQGEMGLEEFLKQVKETWTQYSLELVPYQRKCRLIKGWDDLFSKCSEQLSALGSMKASPYFKVFEEEAASWEDRLTRVHMLFDVWIDVQRQWVYLEGIFSGSADIKHLLPIESSRFQNINTEFLAVMKRVYKSPYVLDVLNLPNIQRSLERLLDLLGKIQRALGEYLERERMSFPRFYFVGDEDLLEIIGNSKDVSRIQKHLRKMFAGIASIELNNDESSIIGMSSRQGEQIEFRRPISLSQFPKINEWLSAVESEMKSTLADLLVDAVDQSSYILPQDHKIEADSLMKWIEDFPAQLIVLTAQIKWTQIVESAFTSQSVNISLNNVLESIKVSLQYLADAVLTDLSFINRKKIESLITELVHQRDIVRELASKRLEIKMANSVFYYGFEYLGVMDKLVQTPLTDRCFLTLTQALNSRLGGSPFGPAGTGKTESVKALGAQLGRFVLVFCCDETFDFQAVGRIFTGLCQVGAWGCFDEFNRLEERILSAVSQQIQGIQIGLKAFKQSGNKKGNDSPATADLVGRTVTLHKDTGIFITMNPDYAGRSNLPDNLKKLFRSICMTKPDHQLIAQVMLYSQGFRSAELMASKAVPLFKLCSEQLSLQPHYDFGLRALKSVLVSAGNIKRDQILNSNNQNEPNSETELGILIQSVRESVLPKLIAPDIPLLESLLSDLFPGTNYIPQVNKELRLAIESICAEKKLVPGSLWVEKLIQLYQIQKINHGLMMVGPSGTGKTTAWQVLLAALERIENSSNGSSNLEMDKKEGVSYVIDPKAFSKDSLYGTLDSTTREWTDGLFTQILRKIIDNVRGEGSRRHWIIFDGDVDPEWVENLNSVLDDNRLLTLPNGERLSLPPNVRIMFEVETLKYATPATVSRCGMVWFSDNVLSFDMITEHYLQTLETVQLGDSEESSSSVWASSESKSFSLPIQKLASGIFRKHFASDGLVERAIQYAHGIEHIMEFTSIRALNTLFLLLNNTVRTAIDFINQSEGFDDFNEVIVSFIESRLLVSLMWSFAGDSPLSTREEFSKFICKSTTIPLPNTSFSNSETNLLDYDLSLNGMQSEWVSWSSRVPTIDIETHRVADADVVVPTTDTLRHENVIYSWLAEHKPILLCGPPGSGKTMTLFAALRKLPDFEVAGLNFSAATSPELILKTFEQYCEYRKTPTGTVLSPAILGRWLVVFCDEINLPAPDKYGTQRVISFMRQLVERGGFWRSSDQQWIQMERIQFVGACNPPTDPGRIPLSLRFLRHVPLIMVDYPGEQSLKQIYSVFSRALLKVQPRLRAYADPLTSAMVDVYLASQRRFTPDQQVHYVYSPRELTRWTRGIFEAIQNLDELSVEGLVKIWAHEALRLFQDRLVTEDEKRWTDDKINEIAKIHFPTINHEQALSRPILFSNWLSRNYVSVDQDVLREHVKARLKVFYEEELDVPLVLFNDVLEHVLRIDRIMRQPQGHALLIGVSGSGKTTLTRFVSWMNGLSVFQIKAHNHYSAADFDEDLRTVLRRSGTRGERICFILDESNVLEPSFLERMNTLLANAEVPGLFEGDEYSALLTACREGASRSGLMLDSPEELYKWFSQQVARNLHVVFTMNPPSEGLASRAATSPALFNRCVLDWFGDWSDQALFQVGTEFTSLLDIERQDYVAPPSLPVVYSALPRSPTYRLSMVNAFVAVHKSLTDINLRLARKTGKVNFVTPRHYLDFIQHYTRLYNERRSDLEEQQRHLNVGLDKLHDTVNQVQKLRVSLAAKKSQLEGKTVEANNKLKQMVEDQNEAERSRAQSIQIQSELEAKDIQIQQRREKVLGDLEKAEPAVLEAQQAVSGINRSMLTEVRTMANPPTLVKLAVESACTLLGHRQTDWRTLQGIIRKDDFISSIMTFDTENKMNPHLCEKMKQTYLNRPDYNFETINRASRACGPLVKWVIAQVNYSSILDQVGPLRNEVKRLEEQALVTKKRATEIEKTIETLEASISKYKDEYAVLITETQQLKTEMEQVSTKVDRSLKLIESLSSERTRWEHTSSTFIDQMNTIAGDVLISAAFLAYAGFFDQEYREQLLYKWTSHLHDSGIMFRDHLNISDYLALTEDKLAWQQAGLQNDDLATENAIMLQHYNRFPLIIDPSGQSLNFLQNNLSITESNRKLTITSFLDDAFLKHLESALRFGNPILIQDAEHVDPILNPILNRELRRTGGRVLIRLGSQDIDYSPAFSLYLFTRDSTVSFSPDLSSRVTFVNFTATRGSLQSQCLNQVLSYERPDVEKRRTDLIRLQGEFRMRLLSLEKELLQALSTAKGNILDNDSVIETLERLKLEAGEISKRVSEADGVMKEIDRATAAYTPLARVCSAIYFALEHLSTLNSYYQFSLEFFQSIFEQVLKNNPNLNNVKGERERLQVLMRDLFVLTFNRASPGLLHKDHFSLLLQLSLIKLQGIYDSESFWTHGTELIPNDTSDAQQSKILENISGIIMDLEFLLTGNTLISSVSNPLSVADEQISGDICKLLNNPETTASILRSYVSSLHWCKPIGKTLSNNGLVDEWINCLSVANPECHIPKEAVCINNKPLGTVATYLRELILIKALRPDRIIHAISRFISVLFDTRLSNYGLFSDFEQSKVDGIATNLEECGLGVNFDLQKVVLNESVPSIPIAFCSVPGYDASFQVEALASKLNEQLLSVAMGSVEGSTLARNAIDTAIKSGRWVLIKNVHLDPIWLGHLEKRLNSFSNANSRFRLFLTMEISPKVPKSLLRASRVLLYEPTPGLRANLLELLHSASSVVPETTLPTERARLHFLLSWLHATLTERLRHVPLGWTRTYEFTDADFACAMSIIDNWLEIVSEGRTNLAPEKIPWDAIRFLLTNHVYGGPMDNDFDMLVLSSFVDHLFQHKSFSIGFNLVPLPSSNSKMMPAVAPEATSFTEFIEWGTHLPEREPPLWLGLSEDAETGLLETHGKMVLSNVRKMRALVENEDDTPGEIIGSSEGMSKLSESQNQESNQYVLPSFSGAVRPLCEGWLSILPSLVPMESVSGGINSDVKGPLQRVFGREYLTGYNLLNVVCDDLKQVIEVCSGKLKLTNHLRKLVSSILASTVPTHWLQVYTVARGIQISDWISGFVLRLGQVSSIISKAIAFPDDASLYKSSLLDSIWLGGLFYAEAFITATRQVAAKQIGCSLEELSLQMNLTEPRLEDRSSNKTTPTANIGIVGLKLQGAVLNKGGELSGANPDNQNTISLSHGGVEKLDVCLLTWERNTDNFISKNTKPIGQQVEIPVYLNADRNMVLFKATAVAGNENQNLYVQRGVAILTS